LQRVAHEEEYWQEDGGRNWVANIAATEALLEPLSARLMTRAAPQSGERALDVGCGGGRTSLALAEAVGPRGHVTGLDVSGPILAVARQRGAGVANLDFVQADAATAELGRARFDLVLSRFGVMFFADPVAAFVNLRRCLKPGGRSVFMCWRAMEDNPWLAAPAAVAFAILPPPEPPDPHAPGPFALADGERTRGILQAAGFGTVQLEPVDVPMHWPDVDAALGYLLSMGPAGALLREAAEPSVEREVAQAVRGVLQRHATADGVRMASAAWIVSAQN
jgi:SAM-dependent methyltransferase